MSDSGISVAFWRWLAICLFACSGIARGADLSGCAVDQLQIGYQGVFKVGCWTRLEFELRGPAGMTVRPVVTVPDPDGNPVDAEFPEVTLSDAPVHVSQLIRLGRLGAAIRIHVEHEGQRASLAVVQTNGNSRDRDGNVVRSVPQFHQLWLVQGEQPAFEHALSRWGQLGDESLHLILVDDLKLFDRDLGEGLNAVVLSGFVQPTEAQSEMLSLWAQRGGRLVVTIGDSVDVLRGGRLAEWLPMLPNGQGTIRNLVPLRELVPRSSSLKVITELAAGLFPQSAGTFLAGQIVVRRSYGFGQVTLLAVRLDQDPLASWDSESQAELAIKLVDVVAPWSGTGQNDANRFRDTELNPTGVTDFQTQLVNSLDTFPNVVPSSNWTVMAALLALILLVGPLDYFLVQRVLQRPHWTWLTLPVLALGFGVLLIILARAANARPLVAQRLEILDLDVEQGVLRSRSWLSFYSPETRRYDLRVAPLNPVLAASGAYSITPRLGWLERPEPGYRGMYHGGGLDLGKARYVLRNDAQQMDRYPLQIWSSGGVDCEWERTNMDAASLFQGDLVLTRANRLQGSLVHHLPGSLEEWFITYHGAAFMPLSEEPWDPGSPLTGDRLRSTTLNYALHGRMDGIEFYDPLALDNDRMVRMMSFHEAAGGRNYSRLYHAGLGNLDCSRVAALDHAVLWGRLSKSVTGFQLSGTDPKLVGDDTYIRIVLPINLQRTDGSAPPPADLLRVP